jgi:hypothetical protein
MEIVLLCVVPLVQLNHHRTMTMTMTPKDFFCRAFSGAFMSFLLLGRPGAKYTECNLSAFEVIVSIFAGSLLHSVPTSVRHRYTPFGAPLWKVCSPAGQARAYKRQVFQVAKAAPTVHFTAYNAPQNSSLLYGHRTCRHTDRRISEQLTGSASLPHLTFPSPGCSELFWR